MTTATLDKRMITAVEAAEYLGVKLQTMALWRSTNRYPELRYVKVGRSIRYRLVDLERWLESRTVGGVDN